MKPVKRIKLKSAASVALGPLVYVLILAALPPETFTFEMRCAIGTLCWMVCWWLLPPVDYPVIGLLPIALNALFPMIPMADIISQYASDSIILVLSGMIITASWECTGLNKRIATAFLNLVGTSVRAQVMFWFLLSTALSTILPNLVVAATISPIAMSMLKYVGEGDIANSKAGSMVVMSVAWGAGLGGMATPIGSASNLVVIEYLEQVSGREYMYIDWVVRFAPIMLTLLVTCTVYVFLISPKNATLAGSKEYLAKVRADMGRMSRDEALCFTVFLVAVGLAFTRSLYAELLPGLAPAYSFAACAIVLFLIPGKESKRIVNWKKVESEVDWGLLYMFGGALSLGKMLTGTGADVAIGTLISNTGVSSTLGLVFIIVTFTLVMSDLTSNGATASMCLPITMAIATALGANATPLLYITAIGINLSFTMPTSIRAIPVGYGLKPSFLAKKGIVLSAIIIAEMTFLGWALIEFWPAFSL